MLPWRMPMSMPTPERHVCSVFAKYKIASLHVFGYAVEFKALMN